MPITKPDIAALADQMPEVDRPGQASKFTGPDPKAARIIFEKILAGGRHSVLELIALLRDPGDPDFKNYKAGYVLHGLALYVGRSGNESPRRMFAETLAAQLDNHYLSKGVKGFLIRELQVAGGREVVKTLGQQLLDDELCEDATQALLAIREGAGAQLRSALRGARGKNRVTLAQALGVVRDKESIAALKKALAEQDRDVRLAAAWALANIGDPSVVDALTRMADTAEGWEKIQTTKACLLLAEKLLADGKKEPAVRIYTHLRDTRTAPAERYARDAAERALRAAR